jgi:hypothetical protein
MRYKAIFPERIFYVEADSEREAQETAAVQLACEIEGSDIIAWEDPETTPETVDGGK